MLFEDVQGGRLERFREHEIDVIELYYWIHSDERRRLLQWNISHQIQFDCTTVKLNTINQWTYLSSILALSCDS